MLINVTTTIASCADSSLYFMPYAPGAVEREEAELDPLDAFMTATVMPKVWPGQHFLLRNTS